MPEVRVWLDDEREAPPGWTRARTAAEAIDMIAAGNAVRVSLDHDLGPPEAQTGYDVLAWLEERLATGRWNGTVPEITVHSANPPGAERMRRAIASIARFVRLNREMNDAKDKGNADDDAG